jgi:hypothetical protein
MIRTDTKLSRVRLKVGSGTKKYQIKKVSTAIPKTAGTKMDATLSATRWIGALDPWTSSTSLTYGKLVGLSIFQYSPPQQLAKPFAAAGVDDVVGLQPAPAGLTDAETDHIELVSAVGIG